MAAQDKIRFDMELLNNVPFKDQITFEEFTGLAMSAIGTIGSTPSARVVVGMIWLMQRVKDPSFTIEQALEYDYNMIDMTAVSDDPTEAAEPTPLQPLRDDKPSRKARATA